MKAVIFPTFDILLLSLLLLVKPLLASLASCTSAFTQHLICVYLLLM